MRSAAGHQHTLKLQNKCQQHDNHVQRQKVYMNIIICQRESVRALQMIRTVGFLQKLSTIDDVAKYGGIPVSRYFLRRYIIVGHFLIPRIPTVEAFPLIPRVACVRACVRACVCVCACSCVTLVYCR